MVHTGVLGVHQDVIVVYAFQLGTILLTIVVILRQFDKGLLA